jgi:hypothetical protein
MEHPVMLSESDGKVGIIIVALEEFRLEILGYQTIHTLAGIM